MNAMNTTPKDSGGVSLLCTPGQALGTAAMLSITGCIGMAFGYQLFLQKRKKGGWVRGKVPLTQLLEQPAKLKGWRKLEMVRPLQGPW